MRRLSGALAAALWLSGCAGVHTDVRTERGPLLSTVERQQVLPDTGILATVETHFPTLTVHFARHDTCRTERLQSYAEQRITEKTSPEAGPAIATGVPTTLLGLGLLAGSGFFSNAPNTGVIDASGHYGPSDRKIATNWSIALLAVGVPALITGAVQLAQTGVSTESRKVEQVADQSDVSCHPKPAEGTAQLVSATGIGPAFAARAGTLELPAEVVRAHPIETFTLDGMPVALAEDASKRIDAFQACAEVLPAPGPETLGEASYDKLDRLGSLARLCDGLPEQPAKALADAVAAEEARREARQPRLPAVQSFEEALQQHPPTLTLTAGSPDLAKLDHPEQLLGQSVLLRGFLAEQVNPNIVVVRVGERPVLVLLQPEALWNTHFPVGSRVEAVAVVAGTQQLGALKAPLVRAIWMRPAFAAMPGADQSTTPQPETSPQP